jgi:hypothetical protein
MATEKRRVIDVEGMAKRAKAIQTNHTQVEPVKINKNRNKELRKGG